MVQAINPVNYPLALIYKIDKQEIDKINFELCQQPKETLEAFYKRQTVKPDFLFNGGFFNMENGNTVFSYVDEGKEINIVKNYLRGIGIKNGELTIGTYNKDFTDFVTGYPVLVENGKVVDTTIASEINGDAKRTILGYDNKYVYLVFVNDPGYGFSKVRSMLLDLDIPNAVNLDGGGSMRLLKGGQKILGSAWSRPVDNVVEIFLKKEQPKILYRVQLGAFAYLENAVKYKEKVQQIKDDKNYGYKNAFVTQVGTMYKVQVGAFSVKANAEKLVTDLKSKGYNSFITQVTIS